MAQATAPLLDSTLAVHCGNVFDNGFSPIEVPCPLIRLWYTPFTSQPENPWG
jgi:hypothetical protein